MIKSKLLRSALTNLTDDDVEKAATALLAPPAFPMSPDRNERLGGVAPAPSPLPFDQRFIAENTPRNLARVMPAAVGSFPDAAALPADTPLPQTAPGQPKGLLRSQAISDEIANLNADNMPREKSFWKRLGGGLMRGLQTWQESGGQGGLIGLAAAAATGGIASGASKGFDAGLRTHEKKQSLLRQLGEARQQEDWQTQTDYKRAQTDNIYADNAAKNQQIADLKAYREGQLGQAEKDRTSREQTTRMRAVASLINKQPMIDVSDPNQASLVEAARSAGLPITDRAAKLQIKPVQDAETGEWSAIISNPYDASGKQVSVPVTTDDGKRFIATSSSKVMSNAADARQKSAQDFSARQEQIRQEMRLKLEAVKNAQKDKDFAREAELKKELLKLRQDYDAAN